MGPPTKALWLNITWSPGRRLILQTWAAGKLQDTLEENDSRWPARGRGGGWGDCYIIIPNLTHGRDQ